MKDMDLLESASCTVCVAQRCLQSLDSLRGYDVIGMEVSVPTFHFGKATTRTKLCPRHSSALQTMFSTFTICLPVH